MTEKNNGPNWKQMKVEYVSTDISMKKLSEKYGVNHNTIQSHAQHEKWTDLRRAARRKANEKLVRQAASKRAKELAKSIDIGYALMAKVQSISADAKDMKSTKRRSETVTEKHLDKLDIDVPVRVVTETDLSELARMYATLMHTLGFDEASQIAHERLELDRLKVEMQVDADMERDERPIIIDERPDAEDEDAEQSEHL